jgi:hypothetical protein
MVQQLAKIVKNKISLVTDDKVAGLVRLAVKPSLMEVGADIAYTGVKFPISADINISNCKKGCFDELVPNSAKKSIRYFEDLGTVSLPSENRGFFKYETKLRLVVWLNWKKIMNTETCESQTHKVVNIIRQQLDKQFSEDDFLNINILVQKIIFNEYEIFANYDYKKNALPFLMYPYESFAIDFIVQYSISSRCEVIITENPTQC